MIISNKALNYIKSSKIDYLLIKDSINIMPPICKCDKTKRAYYDPEVIPGYGIFENIDNKYVKIDTENIPVYTSREFYDKILPETKISLHGILNKKFYLSDFHICMICPK